MVSGRGTRINGEQMIVSIDDVRRAVGESMTGGTGFRFGAARLINATMRLHSDGDIWTMQLISHM